MRIRTRFQRPEQTSAGPKAGEKKTPKSDICVSPKICETRVFSSYTSKETFHFETVVEGCLGNELGGWMGRALMRKLFFQKLTLTPEVAIGCAVSQDLFVGKKSCC